MNETRLRTIKQVQQFLAGSHEIEFSAAGCDQERYGHISRVPKRFNYPRLGRVDKGVILAYLRRTSGYSPTAHALDIALGREPFGGCATSQALQRSRLRLRPQAHPR